MNNFYNYYYDGSFEGLLTVVFDGLKNKNKIGEVKIIESQISFDLNFSYIKTDKEKSDRVKKYIIENFSLQFFNQIRYCFLSFEKNKDSIIIKSIYKVMEFGIDYIFSVDKDILQLRKYTKNVSSESHRYFGILRFLELEEGVLFGTIEPKNNILPIVLSHFKNRFSNEKFAIFDKKRNVIAYYNKENVEILSVESLDYRLSKSEEKISSLWKIFHKNISIKERENKKLQQQNLPKYYWKNLIEEM